MSQELGPRRQAVLRAWKQTASQEPDGSEFDFTPTNRTQRAQEAADAFLADPTEERFEDLWTREVIADAVMGGTAPVLARHESIEDVATTVRDVQTAGEYNPDWVSKIPMQTAAWELYGRLNPSAAPIVNSTCASGLANMGFDRPASFEEVKTQWAAFRSTYESVVGHATAGTDHAVPLHHEMSEFLWYVTVVGDETLQSELQAEHERYFPITGWQDETPLEQTIELTGHMDHIEGLTEAEHDGALARDGPNDGWNKHHWEDWKDEYLSYLSEDVWPTYDKTDLSADEAVQLVDELGDTATLDQQVPTKLYGGATGGMMWTEFKNKTEEAPQAAAEVLSYLFDEEVNLTLRLDRFATFYDLDVSSGAQLSLVTMLLMFAYPTEYILYKYEMMNSFFDEFSEYDVSTGFDSTQYWKLNLVCKKQLLAELEQGFTEKEPTLMDVYTLIFVWHREYSPD